MFYKPGAWSQKPKDRISHEEAYVVVCVCCWTICQMCLCASRVFITSDRVTLKVAVNSDDD